MAAGSEHHVRQRFRRLVASLAGVLWCQCGIRQLEDALDFIYYLYKTICCSNTGSDDLHGKTGSATAADLKHECCIALLRRRRRGAPQRCYSCLIPESLINFVYFAISSTTLFCSAAGVLPATLMPKKIGAHLHICRRNTIAGTIGSSSLMHPTDSRVPAARRSTRARRRRDPRAWRSRPRCG